MRIIGGIYNERSVFPPSDVIYGSGGRAAATLTALCQEVTLTSYIGQNREQDIRYHVDKIWGANLDSYAVPEIVTFTYYHGLSTPNIRPTRPTIKNPPQITVKDDVILQFGMLEGPALAQGRRIVYDPQNPESPEFLEVNGSRADEIAYIVNRAELYRLTGIRRVKTAAKKILKRSNIVAVVVKSGASGAWVYTDSAEQHVESYQTDRVWPIGSGDVFAAVFAYFWAVENCSPKESAIYASRGAALYCDRKDLPLHRKDLAGSEFAYRPIVPKRKPASAEIYIAGPFFTMGQLWLVEETRSALLNSGFKVFSPYHDVGVGEADVVVHKDIKGIENADVLFALCDGLDAGTLFEIGYAVRTGCPVIAFGDQLTSESMKMLRGTGCKIFNDFTSAVYHAQWAALTQ